MNHYRGYVIGYARKCHRDRLMREGTYIYVSEDYQRIDIIGMTGLVDMRREGVPPWIASPECRWERVDSESISRGWQIHN